MYYARPLFRLKSSRRQKNYRLLRAVRGPTFKYRFVLLEAVIYYIILFRIIAIVIIPIL